MVCYKELEFILCFPLTRPQSKLLFIWFTWAQLMPVPAPAGIWVGAVFGGGLALLWHPTLLSMVLLPTKQS